MKLRYQKVFLGQNFHGQKSITISAERFANALENSRYMDTECYEKCISDELISDVRLKQLERITDERLLSAVQMMRREKKSGYQEGIL